MHKKSKSLTYRKAGRGASATANVAGGRSRPSTPLPRLLSPPLRSYPVLQREPDTVLTTIDRRTYNPQPSISRPPRRKNGQPARVVAQLPKSRPQGRGILLKQPTLSTLLFGRPENVQVCVQRNVRKEVLHAQNIAGKTGFKKPKRNAFSSIRC